MKKVIMILLATLAISVTAFADGYNPFDDMYKAQTYRERQRGIAQFNYIIVDESGVAIPNTQLRYINLGNRILSANADAQGKVHIEFRKPNFIQLHSIIINGTEYRVIGNDISEDIDYEDLAKGEVEYFVIQKNNHSQSAFVYDAD